MSASELKGTMVEVRVESCFPNEWNPNKMTDATFDRLTEELEDDGDGAGMIDPIQVVQMEPDEKHPQDKCVNVGTKAAPQYVWYQIVGGEHRWNAFRVLGKELIPAVVLSDGRWKDEDFRKLVTVRLNMLRGEIDPAKFLPLYEGAVKKHGAEAVQRLFAVTDAQKWAALTGGVAAGLKKAGVSKKVVEEFEKATKEMKTVDNLANILNKIFSQHGDTLKNNGYLVFAFGGKENMYVEASEQTMKAINKIANAAAEGGKNINELLEPALLSVL